MTWRPWLEISSFVAIVVADAFAWVPLTQTIILLPVVWVSLRLKREPWSTIRLNWPRRIWRTIACGLLLGILFLLAGRNLAIPIVAHGVSNTLAFVLIYFGRYPGLG